MVVRKVKEMCSKDTNQISDEEYKVLQHIQQAYKEVSQLYSSDSWQQVLIQRHTYIQYIETATEKSLEPDEVMLSQPFTL